MVLVNYQQFIILYALALFQTNESSSKKASDIAIASTNHRKHKFRYLNLRTINKEQISHTGFPR